MNSQIKIGIIIFSSMLFLILLLGWAISYFTNRYAYVDFYKRLELRAVISAKKHLGERESLKAEILQEIRDKHIERLPEETEIFFPVVGKYTYRKWSKQYGLSEDFFEDVIISGKSTFQRGNTLFTGIKHDHEGQKYISIVSANNLMMANYLQNLRNILLIALGLASILALVLSYYLSSRVFNPVNRIIKSVQKISSDNIHLRLDEPNGKDEIGQLVVTFNNLLDRLETAFETQKNFISNASHEFSTPLTSIIGMADVTLKKEREKESYVEALQIILKEADRLDTITRTLLTLAQTGYKQNQMAMELMRTDELIWEVKATQDRLNPKNQVIIDLGLVPDDPKKLKVMGNKSLLLLAFSNIVNNACKYSNNKPVKISIGATDSNVYVVIQDQGIGIPKNEIAFIYDPFFRASNTGLYEGYGIGLPLSRNILRLHKGNIEVNSEEGKGTTITMKFPQGFNKSF